MAQGPRRRPGASAAAGRAPGVDKAAGGGDSCLRHCETQMKSGRLHTRLFFTHAKRRAGITPPCSPFPVSSTLMDRLRRCPDRCSCRPAFHPERGHSIGRAALPRKRPTRQRDNRARRSEKQKISFNTMTCKTACSHMPTHPQAPPPVSYTPCKPWLTRQCAGSPGTGPRQHGGLRRDPPSGIATCHHALPRMVRRMSADGAASTLQQPETKKPACNAMQTGFTEWPACRHRRPGILSGTAPRWTGRCSRGSRAGA